MGSGSLLLRDSFAKQSILVSISFNGSVRLYNKLHISQSAFSSAGILQVSRCIQVCPNIAVTYLFSSIRSATIGMNLCTPFLSWLISFLVIPFIMIASSVRFGAFPFISLGKNVPLLISFSTSAVSSFVKHLLSCLRQFIDFFLFALDSLYS